MVQYFRFPSIISLLITVITLSAQTSYFPPVVGSTWLTLSPNSVGFCTSRIDSLYAFLEKNNTKSFILLKDGKIVLEKYFEGTDINTPRYWASAGKTITSFMVGLAQQDGFLKIDEASSKYLGLGWTSCTLEQESKITIKHQLTMTSGLDDSGNFSCTKPECLKFKTNAGLRWAYHNGPYTLLDNVIANATKTTLNNYIKTKLADEIGMSGLFIKLNEDNVFFSNARSMARFGLLILNKGVWNGKKIMEDTKYFNDMVTPSQSINKSYGYLWWLNGQSSYMLPQSQVVFQGLLAPNAPKDMFSAMGKNGQFLNVIPSQNIVWIRMGDAPDNSLVPFMLNDQIQTKINELTCTSSIKNITKDETSYKIKIKKNPVHDILTLDIPSDHQYGYQIYNLTGQIQKSGQVSRHDNQIEISELQSGQYFIQLRNQKNIVTLRFLIF